MPACKGQAGKQEKKMKKKIIVMGMLAFALFAFVAPQNVFAQKKQKLGETAAKEVFERLKNNYTPGVYDALNIITRYAKAAKNGDTSATGFSWPQGMASNLRSKKIKDLFKVIDAGAGIYEKIMTLQELYDLYMSWNSTKSDPNSIKKAANLQFDTLEFVTGFLAGGAYYKAGIEAARGYVKLLHEHLGDVRWNEIYGDPEGCGLGSYINPKLPKSCSWYTNDAYYDFAKAWFCAAYDPGMSLSSQKSVLMNISEYIWALEVLKTAKLL
jgi:hypothetical protein